VIAAFSSTPADGFSECHGQPGDSHNRAGGQKDSSRPAVNLWVFRAQAADELQRSEHHEEHGWQNVRESQSYVIREMSV